MSGGSHARHAAASFSVDDDHVETPDTVQRRFDLRMLELDVPAATLVMSMPIAGLCNPLTGHPSVGPLAILVDAAAGLSNHYRRSLDEWTVSSELRLELTPDGLTVILGNPNLPVVAASRPVGPKAATALGICALTCGGAVIGGGTVRSFYVPAGDVLEDSGDHPPDGVVRTPRTTLSDLMSVAVAPPGGGAAVLTQRVDPILNNDLGIVNGGVAAVGAELAASGAVNSDRPSPLRTESLQVNFLRPFLAGAESRYVGTPMRVGRNTAVGDAQAIGDDGKVALTARVTAYC
jgi:uncharacterized protein (TIGR00369 family)